MLSLRWEHLMNIILEVLFSFNLVINTNSSETRFTDYATAFSNLELPLVKSEGSESRKENITDTKRTREKTYAWTTQNRESVKQLSSQNLRVSWMQLHNERNPSSGGNKLTLTRLASISTGRIVARCKLGTSCRAYFCNKAVRMESKQTIVKSKNK